MPLALTSLLCPPAISQNPEWDKNGKVVDDKCPVLGYTALELKVRRPQCWGCTWALALYTVAICTTFLSLNIID